VLKVYCFSLFLYFSPVPFDVSTSPNCLSLAKGILVVAVRCVKRVANHAEGNVRKYAERRYGNGWCQEMLFVGTV
jgi:hypothetical protein